MAEDVVHSEMDEIFYIDRNGMRSELKYKKVSEKELDYYSTYVPPSLRGQGLAEKLAQQALDYALENGFHVTPSCWYVAKFIDRHDKYKSLIRSSSDNRSRTST